MWVSWQMHDSCAVQCRPSCVELWVICPAREFGMHPSRAPCGWVLAGNCSLMYMHKNPTSASPDMGLDCECDDTASNIKQQSVTTKNIINSSCNTTGTSIRDPQLAILVHGQEMPWPGPTAVQPGMNKVVLWKMQRQPSDSGLHNQSAAIQWWATMGEGNRSYCCWLNNAHCHPKGASWTVTLQNIL